jgi:hypothetical protein
MAGDKTGEFELDEGFEEAADNDNDEAAKATTVKNSLLRRREIDDLLEERKLRHRIRDYDFDLGDDK